MSVDRLQERIRKMKNPVVLDFNMQQEQIPPVYLEADAFFPSAFESYSKALLVGLKDIVPAVRFSLNRAAVYGAEGVIALKELLRYASDLGYFVLMDAPAAFTSDDAQLAAQNLFSQEWKFDALVVTAYIGSDALRSYVSCAQDCDRSVFVLLKSVNRSGQELQDLLTGSRLVYQAMADVVNRFAAGDTGRSGYAGVAAVAPANAPEALRILRERYKYQFLLVDGYDAPNANAKNCANAFDRLGHGAVVCTGLAVTGAWKEMPWTAEQYLQAAEEAVSRMKKNLSRYITVL